MPCSSLIEHFVRRIAGHHNAIRLAHSVARMRQPVGQVAVVGDQDQPLAVQVEPADGEQPGIGGFDQIDDAHSARGIAVCAQHARGFVDGEVFEPSRVQGDTIDANGLVGRIDPRAQFGDDAAIDLDAAGGDQFLALPPAAEPRGRQHFLQTLRSVGGGLSRFSPRRKWGLSPLTLANRGVSAGRKDGVSAGGGV